MVEAIAGELQKYSDKSKILVIARALDIRFVHSTYGQFIGDCRRVSYSYGADDSGNASGKFL